MRNYLCAEGMLPARRIPRRGRKMLDIQCYAHRARKVVPRTMEQFLKIFRYVIVTGFHCETYRDPEHIN